MPADTANESRIHAVSWHETHRDAVDLAARVAGLGDWQGLIAVSRGGLVPAAVLSRTLGLRIVETLCIASYDGQTKGSVTVLKNAGPAVGDGAGWLMIDDLVDSGATAAAARRLFPAAHFATLYAKPAGRPLVDSFVREVPQNVWIDFPWDRKPANP
jgi:xanthine phosphoribosyltransferase